MKNPIAIAVMPQYLTRILWHYSRSYRDYCMRKTLIEIMATRRTK